MKWAVLALPLFAACHARFDDPPLDLSFPDLAEPDLSRPKECGVIFDNTNAGGVAGAAVGPTFNLPGTNALCELYTYHWNNSGGPAGTIGLQNLTTGVTYGPYQAVGSSGQGGRPNVNWDVQLDPRVQLTAGNYQIVDSDPVSWSWDDSLRDGFAKVLMETGP